MAPSAPSIHDDEIADLILAEKLDQLRADFPEAFYTVAEASEGPVAIVFKRLTKTQYNRAQGMIDDPRRKKNVASTVFRDVVVHPQGAELEALTEDCPAIDDQVATLALEIARGKAPEEAKKLRSSSPKPAATRLSTPAT